MNDILGDNDLAENTINERRSIFLNSPLSSPEMELFADNDIDDPTFCPELDCKLESFIWNTSLEVPNIASHEIAVNPFSLVPYSSTDSYNESIEMATKKKGKKRVRNEKNWKKNIRKKNRLGGKEYVNTKNEVFSAKYTKPTCPEKCRLKCNQRFTE